MCCTVGYITFNSMFPARIACIHTLANPDKLQYVTSLPPHRL
jgi:hypothetical protein